MEQGAYAISDEPRAALEAELQNFAPANARSERVSFSSPTDDASERLGSFDDVDVLMTAQGQQMLAIPRDDQIGVHGDSGGNDLIVIDIANRRGDQIS